VATVPGPDRLIALGKGRDQAKATAQEPPSPEATARQVMSHRLRTPEALIILTMLLARHYMTSEPAHTTRRTLRPRDHPEAVRVPEPLTALPTASPGKTGRWRRPCSNPP
jgi:hypothetical protein